jgi:predicted nucleic acid-binding protein
MIWIDSSFAVEFLLGTSRAGEVKLEGEHLVTLPAQYAEICTFFLRRSPDFEISLLEPLELVAPDEAETLSAARLYLEARASSSKASLADALLAATALSRSGDILAFDEDFRHLGFSRIAPGRWRRA